MLNVRNVGDAVTTATRGHACLPRRGQAQPPLKPIAVRVPPGHGGLRAYRLAGSVRASDTMLHVPHWMSQKTENIVKIDFTREGEGLQS